MVDITDRMCTKSYHIKDSEGTEFTVEQGKTYTTTTEPYDDGTITLFSRYWVRVPVDHFVVAETNPYNAPKAEQK